MTILRASHKLYKRFISPWLGNACRFEPYCSDYAVEAIEKRGIVMGTFLAFKRIVRCHPYCKGGFDPVPDKRSINAELNGR